MLVLNLQAGLSQHQQSPCPRGYGERHNINVQSTQKESGRYWKLGREDRARRRGGACSITGAKRGWRKSGEERVEGETQKRAEDGRLTYMSR